MVAMGLLQAAIWYVGGDGEIGSLRMWQQKMLFVIGINVIICGELHGVPEAGAGPGAALGPLRDRKSVV